MADCGSGNHAVGGGGWDPDSSDYVSGSYPASDAGGDPATEDSTDPRYWAAVFFAAGTVMPGTDTGGDTAYALCVPN